MHHTIAFTASLGNVTNNAVQALTDDVIAISGANFLPQNNFDLGYVFAAGPNTDRFRIASPYVRQITQPFIRPFNGAALPAANPNVGDYREDPFTVRGLEEFGIEATTNAVGPSRLTVLAGLLINREPMPRGDIFTMRGTATTAAVANTWTTIAMTWADNLPTGDYICVGGVAFSTNNIGFRFIFENQYWRPGGVGVNLLASRTHDMFHMGRLGTWGRFKSTRIPLVQVLANAADAAHEVYLELMRVG